MSYISCYISCIEFIRSKLRNVSAHISGVAVLSPAGSTGRYAVPNTALYRTRSGIVLYYIVPYCVPARPAGGITVGDTGQANQRLLLYLVL